MEVSYKVEEVMVDVVRVSDRHRAPVQAAVDQLALSISEVGLRTPISVYQDEEAHVHLVAGHHRLKACAQLGWEMIPAIFLDFDNEVDRERWEIAENLHRAELTVQQRSDHVSRWIALTAEKAKAQLAPSHTGGRPDQGINAAVRELGIDRTEAQRAVKIATMTDDAKAAARAAGLDDNQSALLEVARADPEHQVAKVDELRQRREAGQAATRLSVPRDPIKAAEAVCRSFSNAELTSFLEVILKELKDRQGREAA